MTALDLITRAMRLLGALNIGDAPTAAEAQAGLVALNGLIDSWATERLTKFTSARTVYAVSAGKQQYSIGATGADWTGARPEYIDGAGVMLADGVTEMPLHMIRTEAEWQREHIKSLPSTLPTALYYTPDYPNGTVTLWPAPTVAQSVALYTPVDLAPFATLTTALNLPPGYQRALAYGLAVELAPEFDRQPNALILAIAEQAKTGLKRLNVPGAIGRMRADDALRGHGGHWDWMLGVTR